MRARESSEPPSLDLASAGLHEPHERLHAERLQAVLDALPTGVIIVDAEHRISYANPEVLAMLGGSAELGTHQVTELDGTPVPRERWAASRALRGETTQWMIHRVVARDGRHIVVRAAAVPLRDATGGVSGAVCLLRDCTQDQAAAEERERIERFRETFVGVLGHDLRGPLTAMAVAVGAVLRRDDTAQGSAELLRRALEASERMSRMIDQVLDWTRARLAGGIPVAPATVDLVPLVARVVDEIRAAAPGPAIHLSAPASLVGTWDGDRVAQVVQNLVTNAVVHGDRAAPVRVRVAADGAEARVEVHNAGAPIPGPVLPALFEPFRQGPRRPGSGGLGLGLYIARQLAVAHGGDVEARSTAEDGTAFTLRLPLAPS